MAKAKGLLEWIGRSVDELMKMGYPESVAKRISSGELPMDGANIARLTDQGFDTSTVMYRGLGDPYVEGAGKNATTWATGDPSFASQYAIENANTGANVMPVYVKASNPLHMGFRTSMTEVKPEDIASRVNSRVMDLYESGKMSEKAAMDASDAIWDEWYAKLSDAEQRTFKPVYSYWNNDKNLVDILKKHGFDSIADAEFSSSHFAGKPDVETIGVMDDRQMKSIFAAADPEYTGPNILGSRIAPTAAAGLLGTMALTQSEDADAAALEAGMPIAMQAGGQSAMDSKPDLGRDAGTLIGLLDFLLPFAAEFAKPATMGNAELTEEQRRQRKYYGQ